MATRKTTSKAADKAADAAEVKELDETTEATADRVAKVDDIKAAAESVNQENPNEEEIRKDREVDEVDNSKKADEEYAPGEKAFVTINEQNPNDEEVRKDFKHAEQDPGNGTPIGDDAPVPGADEHPTAEEFSAALAARYVN